MQIEHLTDGALISTIARLGKEMTASSSPNAIAKEKVRMLYIKELKKRGLCGYGSKRKYRQN